MSTTGRVNRQPEGASRKSIRLSHAPIQHTANRMRQIATSMLEVLDPASNQACICPATSLTRRTEGTNTIFFIHLSQIPAGRKATYLKIVASYRP